MMPLSTDTVTTTKQCKTKHEYILWDILYIYEMLRMLHAVKPFYNMIYQWGDDEKCCI